MYSLIVHLIIVRGLILVIKNINTDAMKEEKNVIQIANNITIGKL